MKERERDQPFKTNNICFFTIACNNCYPPYFCLCSYSRKPTQASAIVVGLGLEGLGLGVLCILALAYCYLGNTLAYYALG